MLKIVCPSCKGTFKLKKARYRSGPQRIKCGLCLREFDYVIPRIESQRLDSSGQWYGFTLIPRARSRKVAMDVASDGTRTIGLASNGTIMLSGWNPATKYSSEEWWNIKKIAAGNGAFVGQRADGTVVLSACLRKNAGRYTDAWCEITSIAYDGDDVIGLKSDGSIILQNTHSGAQAGGKYGEEDPRKQWFDIVSITAKDGLTIGIRKDNTVVACKNGRIDKRFSDWTRIKAVSIGSNQNIVGLRTDGTIEATRCLCRRMDESLWKNIIAVAAGPEHFIGRKKNGTVVAIGKNTCGQCDVTPWNDIVAIAAGIDYSIGVNRDGAVVSVGTNNRGQRDLHKWNLREATGNEPAPKKMLLFDRNCSVRSSVPFGAYPYYAGKAKAGIPIEWLVLQRKGDHVLLISRYGIDCQSFHTYNEDTAWETSSIRQWLNSDFMNAAFTVEEQNAIVLPDGGNAAKDKIFLLSKEEAWSYFVSDHDRKTVPTEYAEEHGATVYGSDENCYWLLRTPGVLPNMVAAISADGECLSTRVEEKRCAIRPALWLDLNAEVPSWPQTGEITTDEYIYRGEILDGKAHGYGDCKWRNGDHYLGYYQDNMYHGEGEMIWQDGSKYDGDWQNGKRTGSGTYTFANGDEYEGDFRDGHFAGKGVLRKANGSIVQYRDGKPLSLVNRLWRKR